MRDPCPVGNGRSGAPVSSDPPLHVLPVVLIQPTLERVCQGGLLLVLVAPRWPKQPLFVEIICLLGRELWQLPLRSNLLSQAHGPVWNARTEI